MKIEVIMPQLGESIAEGTVAKWLKKEGDFIKKEESLLEVSTDKIDTEIPSPENGIISKIIVDEGTTVPVNTVIAIIETEAAQKVDVLSVEVFSSPLVSESKTDASSETKEKVSFSNNDNEIRLSPAVRKLIREHNLDIANIHGTGAGGRITAQDVLKLIESKPASLIEKIEVVPMTTMRKKIAEHMVMSRRTSAHVTSVFEIDMTNIVKEREQLKAQFEKDGIKLTYLAFIVQAVIRALKAYPIVNASVQDNNIIYKKDINIGIAVALDWGLIVPVIKNADLKSLSELAREIQELSEKARSKKLKPDDVQDSTFSITNPGVFGALWGTPIINQPNVAILGVGAIVKRPVVINDAIAMRSMMYLSLSYDHRIIDGAIADSFLAHIKNTLEKS